MSLLWLISSLAAAVGGVYLFNLLPARWFCDYGETPAEARRKLPVLPAILCFSAVMALAWWGAGYYLTGVTGPLALLLIWFCLMVSASDILYHILPDQFIGGIALVGLTLMLLHLSDSLFYLLGGIIGGVILLFIGLLGKLIFKAEAMGFGDVKLTAALGLACGVPGIFYGLVIAMLTGAIAALPLLAKKEERRYLPFAPFLCLGGVAALVFSQPISDFIHWYLSLLS